MKNREKYSQQYNVLIALTGSLMGLTALPGTAEVFANYGPWILVGSTVLNAVLVSVKQNAQA